jgi:trehalose/maltose transport system substrate-binding protein
VGVTALPKGGADGKHTGTLGGWQWAVNKYSKNVKAAVDLASYLASPEEQKRAALEVSFNPTIPALYKDPDILAKNPFIGELLDTFTNAVARPSQATGAKYNQVSSEFWNAVHDTLAGTATAEESLSGLEKRLDRIGHGGKW